MFRSEIQVTGGFSGITARVEALARRATQEAAAAAAQTAQANASIDLELELIPAHSDPGGFAAGIRSRKTGRASSVEIATFFDGGTLAGRKKPLKRPGRDSWTVKRSTGPYTAQRRSRAGGIEAERFFLKARIAGRKAMVSVVKHGS